MADIGAADGAGEVSTTAIDAGILRQQLDLLAKRSHQFDLVFSDVVMPGMNGIALGEQVRKRYPGIPVVLTSGYNAVMAEEGWHGFELVLKPYTADNLVNVFRRVIAGLA